MDKMPNEIEDLEASYKNQQLIKRKPNIDEIVNKINEIIDKINEIEKCIRKEEQENNIEKTDVKFRFIVKNRFTDEMVYKTKTIEDAFDYIKETHSKESYYVFDVTTGQKFANLIYFL